MQTFKLIVCVCALFSAVLAEEINDLEENSAITWNELEHKSKGSSEGDLTPWTGLTESQTEELKTAQNETPTLEIRKKKLKATTTVKKPSLGETEDKPGTNAPEGIRKTARCSKGGKGGKGYKGKKGYYGK